MAARAVRENAARTVLGQNSGPAPGSSNDSNPFTWKRFRDMAIVHGLLCLSSAIAAAVIWFEPSTQEARRICAVYDVGRLDIWIAGFVGRHGLGGLACGLVAWSWVDGVHQTMQPPKTRVFMASRDLLTWLSIALFFIGNAAVARASPFCSGQPWYKLGLALLLITYIQLLAPILALVVLMAGMCCCLPTMLRLLHRLGVVQNSQTPATRRDIARLPEMTYNASTTGNGLIGDPSCPICLANYSGGEKVRRLPCGNGHHFHKDCIDQWLAINANCPVCRGTVIRADGSVVVEAGQESISPRWGSRWAFPGSPRRAQGSTGFSGAVTPQSSARADRAGVSRTDSRGSDGPTAAAGPTADTQADDSIIISVQRSSRRIGQDVMDTGTEGGRPSLATGHGDSGSVATAAGASQEGVDYVAIDSRESESFGPVPVLTVPPPGGSSFLGGGPVFQPQPGGSGLGTASGGGLGAAFDRPSISTTMSTIQWTEASERGTLPMSLPGLASPTEESRLLRTPQASPAGRPVGMGGLGALETPTGGPDRRRSTGLVLSPTAMTALVPVTDGVTGTGADTRWGTSDATDSTRRGNVGSAAGQGQGQGPDEAGDEVVVTVGRNKDKGRRGRPGKPPQTSRRASASGAAGGSRPGPGSS